MQSPNSFSGSSHQTLPAPTALTVRKSAFWDRVARKYASDPISDVAGYETTVRRVQEFLTSDQVVLEIGCGTGTTALRLADSVRTMLATDVSAGMIAIAREKLSSQPQTLPRLTFAIADADVPSFGSSTYDVLLAFNSLHMLNDLDRGLELLLQVLKPGGLLISKTPCVSDMNPLIRYLALPLMKAIGKAPHVLCFKAQELQLALVRQGMEIVAFEWHGSRGKDTRVFIVARKHA